MKIKDALKMPKYLLDQADEKLRAKNYKGALLYTMALTLLIISALLLVFFTVVVGKQVIQFIAENWKFLTFVIGGGIWTYFFFTSKRQEKQNALAEQKAREDLEAELAQQRISEQNYQTARKILFSILENIAPSVGLERPDELSNLDAPRHCTIKNNIVLFNYIAVKTGEINPRKITTLIETRFQQLADSGELDISPAHVVLYSQIYPALMVDSVQDMGSFAQIRLTIPGENYIRQRSERERQNLLPSLSGRGEDHDF